MALVLKIRIGFPIFYPGVGAIIDLQQITLGPADNGLLGISGPIFGTIASAGCWVEYTLTSIFGARKKGSRNGCNLIPT